MERITSFCVDHTKLTPGVYVSRVDDNLTTFDLRMTTPNLEPALKPEAAHTIEHIGATLLRMVYIKIKLSILVPWAV
ncbi:S-ribosylhomocysteine lyase [Thomasclavelia sp.]|uniref:S-ribosylhomocysteine lyase n=1 Tax=Thomasclavelia sp. TaxID=3025757 RepID=UPI00345D352E